MLKKGVLAFYHGNQSAVARALHISRASVNGWGEIVPERSARRLHALTRGKLKFDPRLYDPITGRVLAPEHRPAP